MLGSFLDLEVIGEVLSVMEKLSANQHNKATVATSSVFTSILKIMDSESFNSGNNGSANAVKGLFGPPPGGMFR